MVIQSLMRNLLFGTLALITSANLSAMIQDQANTPDSSLAEKYGWKLGVQTYSFNRFTFFEAVEKAAAIGLKYVEAYPGQTISGDFEGKMGPGMTEEQIQQVQQKLQQAGVQIIAFGVTGLSANEEESRKTFDWCKKFNVQVINTEVRENAFDTLEKLCEEYQIKIGIHNHPKPSYYWDPETVKAAIEGRSHWIGACADTGHWIRSGREPLECLKVLEGRIVSFHFKDLHQSAPNAHDVPWGQGVANVPGLLAEMKRQNFQGPVSIEYEHNWLNSLPEIKECVQNFHNFVDQLEK
jgi:sugar phosphate isomerase/epimerase